jgi:hypothetical protein
MKKAAEESEERDFEHRQQMAAALRAVRKLAGFESAGAAAESLRFSNAAYRSHEAGSRAMSEEDVERYAVAFGVPVKTIARPDPRRIGQALKSLEAKEAENSKRAEEERKAAGTRLKIARLARGWDSGSNASRTFKVATQTYLGHENGTSSFSASAGRLYAALLGVRLPWLMEGRPPSGLGQAFDAQIERGLKPDDVPNYRNLVASSRAAPPSEIATLRAALKDTAIPGWAKSGPDLVREIDAAELREFGFHALRTKRVWPFPKGFVRTALRASTNALIVVVCDKAIGQSHRGDRLIVDTSRTRAQGELLGLRQGSLIRLEASEVDFSDRDLVIFGQIVATFALAQDRP